MTRVLLNALASTAGGGITYLTNVLPQLEQQQDDHHYVVLVPPEQFERYHGLSREGFRIETVSKRGTLARLWWEQTGLRRLVQSRQIDVLISLGNFALLRSPVRQILFNRNDLYFSPEFSNDLRHRKLFGALITHQVRSWLARQSIKQATMNVTPTTAFARRIQATNGLGRTRIETLPFGFDVVSFTNHREALPETLQAKLNLKPNCRRVLYVSHYNYFRNFETLIRALPILKSRLKQQTGEDVQLVLTTDIQRGAVYGGYDATAAAELIDRLGVREDVAMLGAVEYSRLHRLYQLCDVFVCPSYSESFGHPLVEAMASGVPVASADLPVHREVCGDAAEYFGVFDEAALAAKCVRLLADAGLLAQRREEGLRRSRQFSWQEHARQLTVLIDQVAALG